MSLQSLEKTQVVLAQAADLTRLIAHRVLGNDAADSISGQPITSVTTLSLAQTVFRRQLTKSTGV